MDTLTQGLLGAVTAQLGFRQRIGREATWVAGAAAVLPDLDIFIVPLMRLAGTESGDLYVMSYHRGLSHSLLAVPVIAAGVAGIWWWLRRRARRNRNSSARPGGATAESPDGGAPPGFGTLFACCFVAVLSHPLLDWCTSYGTQLLAPITNARFGIDAVPIIDVLYTPVLALTLLGCYLIRKLTGARAATQGGQGPRRGHRATLIVGWAGFVLSTAYLATGAAINWRLRHGLPEPMRAARAEAYPQICTIFVWRVTAEDDRAWYVARHNVLFSGPLRAEDFTRIPKVENEWIQRARRLPDVKTYCWFSRGQIRATYDRLDGLTGSRPQASAAGRPLHVVEFHDMRYGILPESPEALWPLRVTFDAHGEVLDISRRHRYRHADLGKLVRQMWRDVWTP